MSPVTIVLLVILAVLIAATIALYFLGKKAQKRKDEQDAQLAATAQTVTMLIIDKKRMRLNQSGLPQAVIDQTPKLMRRSKLPIVKAKVGPKVMTLIADDACFDMIPVKKRSQSYSKWYLYHESYRCPRSIRETGRQSKLENQVKEKS